MKPGDPITLRGTVENMDGDCADVAIEYGAPIGKTTGTVVTVPRYALDIDGDECSVPGVVRGWWYVDLAAPVLVVEVPCVAYGREATMVIDYVEGD